MKTACFGFFIIKTPSKIYNLHWLSVGILIPIVKKLKNVL